MSITPDEIIATAKLAKLQVDDKDISEVTERISAILELVDQMQAIDTSEIQPMANVLDAVQYLRPDTIVEPDNKILRRDQFQQIAPATDEGLYLVPKVIE